MTLILVFIIAIVLGTGAGYLITRGQGHRALAPAPAMALPAIQKMICPYDGLEVDGNSELDRAVHMQCILMTKFQLEQEVDKRAHEIFEAQLRPQLPAPVNWSVDVNTRSDSREPGSPQLGYRYRWQVTRDGAVMASGWQPYRHRADMRAARELTEQQRRNP